MATSLSLLLIASVTLLLSPPSLSLTCTSQTFSHNTTTTTFSNCTDLPTLKATLHWTYDPSSKPNPTLSIAFIAAPPKPDGWVAWALNPTDSGMIDSQALIAFKDTNGSVVVKTYNISSYGPVSESMISYGVLSKRAEFSGGAMRIFATVALPEGTAAEVNQVWQVGAAVSKGVPAKHDFAPENLNSKNTLRLVSKAAEGPGGSGPAAAPASEAAAGGGQTGNVNGGSELVVGGGLWWLHGFLVLLGVLSF